MSSPASEIEEMSRAHRRGLIQFACAAVSAAVLAALTACSPDGGTVNEPPESEYTQAEAYAPMEAAVADSIAALPDFPGFGSRTWHQNPCSHDGIDDPDYVNVEIWYDLTEEDSQSDLVREDYVAVLRELWESQGYEITADDSTQLESRVDHILSAKREDGISLGYAVGRYAGFIINSGCVPVSELSEIEYIPPVGGIEPGSDQDNVDRYFPDGTPTDHAAAIDPFAGMQAAFGPMPFDSPATYDDQL